MRKCILKKFTNCCLLVATILLFGQNAEASITVVNETSAANLQMALLGGGGTGISVSSFTLSGQSFGSTASTGTYSSDGDAYGLGGTSGIVLSSGNAEDYSTGSNSSTSNTTDYGVPATAAQEGLLDPITGGGFNHNDVTQIDIEFSMLEGFDTVFFDLVFGSEEFDEFVGTEFIDGFGLYLDGVNIAFVNGDPVNIDHPDFAMIAETELDGVLAPDGNAVLSFSAFVGAGAHTLTFILADTSDGSLDSTVYINALGGTPPGGQIPEPTTLAIWGCGLFGVSLLRRRKRNC